jgi:hypothetical protein
VKGGATVTKKMNGDSAKRKGEQWTKNQRSKVAKLLRKHKI